MEIKHDFEAARQRVEDLTTRPTNEELLKLYGLFKQATMGDAHGDEPGGFDFKAVAKFRAWKENQGQAADVAMAQYIDFANELVEKYK